MAQMEKEFNLLHEPWIRVMRPDASVEEVSLIDALIHSKEYSALAGEMPTQDVAILRLLLAVLYVVFSKFDPEGQKAPLLDEDEAIERWDCLWEAKEFPEKILRDYLNQYEDRFWLFHPERPFYQAATALAGSSFNAQKLNGEILESDNKTRMFSMRIGEGKNKLTYSEAARWLIQLNGYDDSSLKKKVNSAPDKPTFKDGWLGQLGVVYAVGKNLFETLMLNLVLSDRHGEVWSSATPIWEREEPDQRDLLMVKVPHDQAALLTLQSRRIYLHREEGFVTGYQVLGGEQFEPSTAIEAEQMTMWKRSSKKNNIEPKLHDLSKQFWREFTSLTENAGGVPQPGFVRWHQQVDLPGGYVVNYQAVGMKYGDSWPHSSVDSVFFDTISFHLNLLSDLGSNWRRRIADEISQCDNLAKYIWWLAVKLCRAAGGKETAENNAGEYAKAQFYYRIDIPFREWLITLDAKQSDTEIVERQYAWHDKVRAITLRLGEEMVEAAGPAAYQGRVIKDKDKGSLYTAATALNDFKREVNKKISGRDANGDK